MIPWIDKDRRVVKAAWANVAKSSDGFNLLLKERKWQIITTTQPHYEAVKLNV